MLVLDHQGRVLHYTVSAERWLRELEDLGAGWQEGNGLPVAVWTVVGALRRALKPQTERDRTIIPRVCVRARSGRWLTLQAEQGELHSGRAGGTMILLEPAGPKRSGLAQRDRLRPKFSGRGGGQAHRGRSFHQADLPNALHHRVHRPKPPPERLREGRRTQPASPRQTTLLRQPLSDALRSRVTERPLNPRCIDTSHQTRSLLTSANCATTHI